MATEQAIGRILVGVGAAIWNARDEILLIRRANPPRQNEWSLPGGKVEFGETLQTALLREIHEETGLEIEILGLIDVAELLPAGPEHVTGSHFVLVDFSARILSGEVVAGSDALEARWFTMEEVAGLALWHETHRIIRLSARNLKITPSN